MALHRPSSLWLRRSFVSMLGVFLFQAVLAQERHLTTRSTGLAQLPACEAFRTWLAEHPPGPNGLADRQELNAALKLARVRALELRALMEADPEQFVRRAMPAAERAQLPLPLQALIERPVKERGSF